VAIQLYLEWQLQQAVVVVVVAVLHQTLAAQAVGVAVKETTPLVLALQDKEIAAVQAVAEQPVAEVAVQVLSAAMVLDRAAQVAQERHLQSQAHP
jgi:hypothetical protein